MILFFLQFRVTRVEIYHLIRLVIRMVRVFRQREKRVLTKFVFVDDLITIILEHEHYLNHKTP